MFLLQDSPLIKVITLRVEGGGGGYIKIVKVNIKENKGMEDILINAIGDSITKNKAYNLVEGLLEEGIITERGSKHNKGQYRR